MASFIEKILGVNREVTRIKVKLSVVEEVMRLAKETYPKEFLIFLEGNYKKKEIIAKDLIFQPYIADETSALPRIDFPLTTSIVGSIHSHPGHRNKPSRADLRFFHKTGLVHGIICRPYNKENLAFYDINGDEIEVEII